MFAMNRYLVKYMDLWQMLKFLYVENRLIMHETQISYEKGRVVR